LMKKKSIMEKKEMSLMMMMEEKMGKECRWLKLNLVKYLNNEVFPLTMCFKLLEYFYFLTAYIYFFICEKWVLLSLTKYKLLYHSIGVRLTRKNMQYIALVKECYCVQSVWSHSSIVTILDTDTRRYLWKTMKQKWDNK
jgi:hypothetical protein